MAHTDTPPAIPSHIAHAAVHWLLELSGGDAATHAQKRRQWQSWMDADPVHALAWQRIEEMDGRLRKVSPPAALRALSASGLSRRHAVQLAVLLTAGAGSVLAWRDSGVAAGVWSRMAADLSTPTGEQREALLADGTRLLLNTATAVDLRFSSHERLIVLRMGEIFVQSGSDPVPDPQTGVARPLRVQTRQGIVHAIGTRFTVRHQDAFTSVSVLDGAVELRPKLAPEKLLKLQAGEAGRLTDAAVERLQPVPDGATAWTQGMLVADDMPLPEFLAELSRHRPGVLRCTPDAAQLRVSGSYPLGDTDRVLHALTRSLPVRVHQRTRWWTTVALHG